MTVNNTFVSTKVATQILANHLGCTVSEVMSGSGWNHPAVFDAEGVVAERLKEAGARRAASGKALTFPSWSRLHAVLATMLKEPNEFAGRAMPRSTKSEHLT